VFFQEFRKDLLTMFNNLAIIDSKALLLHAQVAMRQLALTVQQNPQGLRYAWD
jgi:hypothetical protein